MPVWAAARCTAAVTPYFKPLRWQGKMLLDGGFKLNCPAARAYSEAKYIWPGKHCDILLSLGTGTSRSHLRSQRRNPFGVGKAVPGDMIDAQKAWAEFLDGHLQSHTLLRLNPLYRNAFTLDDAKKLKDIQKQTEEWILTKDEEVNNICDRLVAALFFFCPSSEIRDGVQVGRIFCRLPAEEGQKLVDGILQKADLPLFAVKYNGETFADINVNRAFADPRFADELCFEVTCRSAPITSDIEIIEVEMRSLTNHATFPWLPISGSPYIIREKLDGPDMLATVREPCNFDSMLKDPCAVA
jgi:hypothetical protein